MAFGRSKRIQTSPSQRPTSTRQSADRTTGAIAPSTGANARTSRQLAGRISGGRNRFG